MACLSPLATAFPADAHGGIARGGSRSGPGRAWPGSPPLRIRRPGHATSERPPRARFPYSQRPGFWIGGDYLGRTGSGRNPDAGRRCPTEASRGCRAPWSGPSHERMLSSATAMAASSPRFAKICGSRSVVVDGTAIRRHPAGKVRAITLPGVRPARRHCQWRASTKRRKVCS